MAPSKAYPVIANGASSPSDKSMADATSVGNDVNDDGSIAVGFLTYWTFSVFRDIQCSCAAKDRDLHSLQCHPRTSKTLLIIL